MTPMVRAFYRVAAIEGAKAPYDRVSLKIYYPAAYTDSPEERNSGVIPANAESAPYPVIILLPGINLGPESSGWLAARLAGAGYVTVTSSCISEEMPGYVSISPGLLLDQLTPENFGRSPSCSLLAPVLKELSAVQESSVLAGLLDLENIVLGGHSAGGTTALINAKPEWFPGVVAAFSYAAHSGASVALGWPEETILKLPAALPTLIMGGDRDGVIAASAHRYGRAGADPMHPLIRTFDEALPACRENSYLLILRGANHFTFAGHSDNTTGRPFLDWDSEADPDQLRTHLGGILLDFLGSIIRRDGAAKDRLTAALKDERFTVARRK